MLLRLYTKNIVAGRQKSGWNTVHLTLNEEGATASHLPDASLDGCFRQQRTHQFVCKPCHGDRADYIFLIALTLVRLCGPIIVTTDQQFQNARVSVRHAKPLSMEICDATLVISGPRSRPVSHHHLSELSHGLENLVEIEKPYAPVLCAWFDAMRRMSGED